MPIVIQWGPWFSVSVMLHYSASSSVALYRNVEKCGSTLGSDDEWATPRGNVLTRFSPSLPSPYPLVFPPACSRTPLTEPTDCSGGADILVRGCVYFPGPERCVYGDPSWVGQVGTVGVRRALGLDWPQPTTTDAVGGDGQRAAQQGSSISRLRRSRLTRTEGNNMCDSRVLFCSVLFRCVLLGVLGVLGVLWRIQWPPLWRRHLIGLWNGGTCKG